jgi:hypothetical protein
MNEILLVGPDNPDAGQMTIPIRNDNPAILEYTVPFIGTYQNGGSSQSVP